MRRGPLSGLSSASTSHPPQLLENKLASQEAEIERIALDNHKLAKTHVALREALAAAAQDVQKLKSHIRSIQTESDIQIRVLLDKIAKMDVEIRASDSVKKELQQAHIEAQSLAASRQELHAQIQLAKQEVRNALTDVKSMPHLQAELDNLVQEHQRLHATFEYEKSKNVELVDQLKAKEKKLIAMAREVEILRAEILNTEKRINATILFGASTPVEGGGTFRDPYWRAHDQIAVGQLGEPVVQIGDSNGLAAVNSTCGSGAGWAGRSA